MTQNAKKLPRSIYMLLMLYADSKQPIIGRTRLEKLMFLVHMRVVEEMKISVSSSNYRFRSWRFGPFTEDVFDDVAALTTFGLLEVKGDDEGTQSFSVSPKGVSAVDRLLSEKSSLTVVFDEISRIKKSYGGMNLEDLVGKVYRQYPEYTDKSEIRDRFASTNG